MKKNNGDPRSVLDENEVTAQSSKKFSQRVETLKKLLKEITHYPNKRWFVLLAFSLGSLSNQMAWLTFAPIPFETKDYYGITG